MSTGVELGVPMPCFSTALAFYDGYRSEMLPANLLQAQRVRRTEVTICSAKNNFLVFCFYCNLSFQLNNFSDPFFWFPFQDYFGAHTYELLSNPGKFVHTNWTGTGGNVSSTTYDA